MKYFQTIMFIIETIFISLIIVFGVLFSLNIIKDKNTWLKSGNIYKSIIEVILRIIMFFLFVLLFVFSLLPRILDIPNLVTWQLSSTEGPAIIERSGCRDFFQQVIVGGTEVKFFLDSGINEWEYYKVSYLPKSHRAIDIEKEGIGLSKKEKNVQIPWEEIIAIISGTCAVIFLNRFGFWVLIVGSAVFYSLNIYLCISYGLSNGAWTIKNNDALVFIIGGICLLIMVGVFYFIEKILRNKQKSRYFEKITTEDEFYISRSSAYLVVYCYVLSMLNYFNIV